MDAPLAGDLVRLATAGPTVDAIVFDVANEHKVVVAVVDPKRGPVLRTVGVEALSERAEAGAQDGVLQALIRRTPSTARTGRSGANGPVQGRRGHTRAAMHRTTGR